MPGADTMNEICGVCKANFDKRCNAQDCAKCFKPVHKSKCAKLISGGLNNQFQELVCTNCLPKEVMAGQGDGSAATKADVKMILDEILSLKNTMENRIKPLEVEVDNLKEEVERVKEVSCKAADTAAFNGEYSRRNNLEIHGIPYVKGENVYHIVEELGKILEVELDDSFIDAAHRLRTKSTIKPPPIIVRLVNRWKKEDIMKARMKKVITAEELGYKNSPLRVFINENLSPNKRYLAMLTRRYFNGKGCSTWTNNGTIMVARKVPKEARKQMDKEDPNNKKYEVHSPDDFEHVAKKLGLDDKGKHSQEH